MKDRQVEVVGGGHAVAGVAGAVLVVRHRGPGPLHQDSPAMMALESLAELIREAAGYAPDGYGAQVARQATRWLMTHAEQISPGVPIDLGILSPAESGGIAIFLHGSVTAVLSEAATTEHIRGSDAAFTVDRVVTPPTRAIAVFVDDGRPPALPQRRGIGWLVEGIAEAGGAIVWSAEARGRTTEFVDQPGPTARIDPSPTASPRDIAPTASPHAEAFPPTASTPEASHVSPFLDTERATALLDTPHDQAAFAPTEIGTNPAPRPDPDLQRRLEATAKATALTVKVLGFKCARAHPSDPRAAFCTVCGMPVDQTQALIEVVRPPLGMLVLDDGMTFMLAADVVVGRDPDHSEPVQRGLLPLRIDDSSGGMSRAHAEIRLTNWDVTLLDRGSTNGTRTRPPGYRDWIRLNPNLPVVLTPGTEIMIGNRVLRYELLAPPPFGR
ncbi:FHA domain-containing protein [Nocardia panacis]|uniref:FHA domain-containing protein n=1 Tax=Nocardia panacis TaxID=2340916 RepID=A0A3A4JY98_9NOCA|nr:FHA domain-containing protein [Nocardia panacis]RJO72143.1 FHA domain-containing protein [Nocardia panacis]